MRDGRAARPVEGGKDGCSGAAILTRRMCELEVGCMTLVVHPRSLNIVWIVLTCSVWVELLVLGISQKPGPMGCSDSKWMRRSGV